MDAGVNDALDRQKTFIAAFPVFNSLKLDVHGSMPFKPLPLQGDNRRGRFALIWTLSNL